MSPVDLRVAFVDCAFCDGPDGDCLWCKGTGAVQTPCQCEDCKGLMEEAEEEVVHG